MEPQPTRPPYIPPGVDFAQLPAPLQSFITEILSPLYHDVVTLAANPLERAIGQGLVDLVWLEAIETYDIHHALARTLPNGGGTDEHQTKLERHMRLITQKLKTGRFFLDLEKFYISIGATDPLRRSRNQAL